MTHLNEPFRLPDPEVVPTLDLWPTVGRDVFGLGRLGPTRRPGGVKFPPCGSVALSVCRRRPCGKCSGWTDGLLERRSGPRDARGA